MSQQRQSLEKSQRPVLVAWSDSLQSSLSVVAGSAKASGSAERAAAIVATFMVTASDCDNR